MSKELELTEIEQKVQKIINDADKAFERNDTGRGRRYFRENMRCEFLKVHLMSSLETIEHLKRMEKANDEFYMKALSLKSR